MTHRVVRETPYYLHGPQQASPPDGRFAAGTEVELLQDGGSYSKVRSDAGVTAWAATKDLEPL